MIWTKERTRTIVVPANLFLILALGVDDDLRKEAREDILEELRGEVK